MKAACAGLNEKSASAAPKSNLRAFIRLSSGVTSVFAANFVAALVFAPGSHCRKPRVNKGMVFIVDETSIGHSLNLTYIRIVGPSEILLPRISLMTLEE